MSTWQLDTEKLVQDIEQARAGRSYRQVAREIGMSPEVLIRLRRGRKMDADNLLSLLIWLGPETRARDYALQADRPRHAAAN